VQHRLRDRERGRPRRGDHQAGPLQRVRHPARRAGNQRARRGRRPAARGHLRREPDHGRRYRDGHDARSTPQDREHDIRRGRPGDQRGHGRGHRRGDDERYPHVPGRAGDASRQHLLDERKRGDRRGLHPARSIQPPQRDRCRRGCRFRRDRGQLLRSPWGPRS
jgi:hypothetical protein